MRLRLGMVAGTISVAALIGGGMVNASASPSPNDGVEHGGGFNCTHGDEANQKFGIDHDRGNGHDCLPAVLVTPTTVAATPTTAATPAAAAAAKPAAAVAARPRVTG